jgi:hypothetical protein
LTRVISEFTTKGWKEATLQHYYTAKQKLYQTRIYIPSMSANRAPAAFQCGPEVKPSDWLVVYRGVVTPPKSGTYRFAGAGDDLLVVRFNGKNVLDHGFISGTSRFGVGGAVSFLKGEREDAGMLKIIHADYPMRRPVTFYTYPTTRNWNDKIGGIALGAEFQVTAGSSYPIEILLSESGGNLFCASLLIQEKGVAYPKAASGSPILPLFRLDESVPPSSTEDNSPPYDPKGPVWKLVPGSRKLEI